MEQTISLLPSAKAGWHHPNINVIELWIVLLYFYTVPAELYSLTFPTKSWWYREEMFSKVMPELFGDTFLWLDDVENCLRAIGD